MALTFLESCTSTMDAAREAIRDGSVTFRDEIPGPFGGIVTRRQTSGRGQRGRTWYAPPGEALLATFYLPQPADGPVGSAEIALGVGVAVAEVVGDVIAAHQLDGPTVGLKWPNDLMLGDKKMGGILIEMIQTRDSRWVALVGVGLNLTIRSFPPDLSEATSLALEGYKPPDPVEIGERVEGALHRLDADRAAMGPKDILRRWRHYDRTAGRRFRARIDGRSLIGTAIGISESGALLLLPNEGVEIIEVTAATSIIPV